MARENGRITTRAAILVCVAGTALILAFSVWRLQRPRPLPPAAPPAPESQQPRVAQPQPGPGPQVSPTPETPPAQARVEGMKPPAPSPRAAVKPSPGGAGAAGRPRGRSAAAPAVAEVPVAVPIGAAPDLPGVAVPLAPPALPSGARVFENESAALAQVLGRYEQAFDRLDAKAATAVWPAADARALARAFSRLQHQDLDFGDCTFAVSASDAAARCVGVLRYARRIGDTSPKTEQHVWTIQFLRRGQIWQIARIAAE